MAVGVAAGGACARRAEQGLVVGAAPGGGCGVAGVAERGAPVGRRGDVHADVAGQAEARAVLGAVEERAQRGAAGAGDVVVAHGGAALPRRTWRAAGRAAGGEAGVGRACRGVGSTEGVAVAGWWRPIDNGGGSGSMP